MRGKGIKKAAVLAAVLLAALLLWAPLSGHLQLLAARGHMERGEFDAAIALLEQLPGARAASELEACYELQTQALAEDLIARGEFAHALLLLEEQAPTTEWAAALVAQATQGLKLEQAQQAEQQGLYFSAQLLYKALAEGGLPEGAALAARCKQPIPAESVLFSALGDKEGGEAELYIRSGQQHAFVEVLDGAGAPVLELFLNGGEQQALFYLPQGDYRLRYSEGTDWFGVLERFGAAATHELALSAESHKRYSLDLGQNSLISAQNSP